MGNFNNKKQMKVSVIAALLAVTSAIQLNDAAVLPPTNVQDVQSKDQENVQSKEEVKDVIKQPAQEQAIEAEDGVETTAANSNEGHEMEAEESSDDENEMQQMEAEEENQDMDSDLFEYDDTEMVQTE